MAARVQGGDVSVFVAQRSANLTGVARAPVRASRERAPTSEWMGATGRGWFLSFHCYTQFMRLAFFRGAGLKPMPPGTSKLPNVRYLDVREGDELDLAQLASWFDQAARLPGWNSP